MFIGEVSFMFLASTFHLVNRSDKEVEGGGGKDNGEHVGKGDGILVANKFATIFVDFIAIFIRIIHHHDMELRHELEPVFCIWEVEEEASCTSVLKVREDSSLLFRFHFELATECTIIVVDGLHDRIGVRPATALFDPPWWSTQVVVTVDLLDERLAHSKNSDVVVWVEVSPVGLLWVADSTGHGFKAIIHFVITLCWPVVEISQSLVEAFEPDIMSRCAAARIFIVI